MIFLILCNKFNIKDQVSTNLKKIININPRIMVPKTPQIRHLFINILLYMSCINRSALSIPEFVSFTLLRVLSICIIINILPIT